MKIENIAAPGQTPVHGTQTTQHSKPSLTDRMINAFNAAKTPPVGQHPVSNPTSVSPEELGAIRASEASQTAQGHTNEAPVEAPAAPKAPEEPLSSQYATLARKEKALRQREAQLRAREAAAAKAAEPPKPAAPTFDESKYVARDRLTQDPFSVLNELGLTYDQLTEMALNAPKPEQLAIINEMKLLKQQIESLKGDNETTKKSFEENQKQQYTQAINHIRNEASALVRNDPSFETIKATGSINEVVGLIERTFNEDGILMTVEDAAREVEEYLVDEAIKLARLKKIQQRLSPTQSAPAQKPASQSNQQELKTLTNATASTKKLSVRERAILAAEGKLNN